MIGRKIFAICEIRNGKELEADKIVYTGILEVARFFESHSINFWGKNSPVHYERLNNEIHVYTFNRSES